MKFSDSRWRLPSFRAAYLFSGSLYATAYPGANWMRKLFSCSRGVHNPLHGNTSKHTSLLRKAIFIPTIIGSALLIASGLKWYELASMSPAEIGLLTSPSFVAIAAEVELALGMWLLSGIRSKQARFVALGVFSGFSILTFVRAINGNASCGCFGRLSVSPWYTLSFDLLALAILMRWRPDAMSPMRRSKHYCVVVALFVMPVLGIPAGATIAAFHTTHPEGNLIVEGQFVSIEPESWTGQRFPLRAYVDIGDDLMHGHWIVLFFHHDCPECRKQILSFRHWAVIDGAPRLAFVQVPPYGNTDFISGYVPNPYRLGVLSDSKRWFVKTPSILYLANGVVRSELEGKAWLQASARSMPTNASCLMYLSEGRSSAGLRARCDHF